jgi:hypothetical protein
MDDPIPPPNQASTSNATPHVQLENQQASAFQLQGTDSRKKDATDPQIVPSQPLTNAAPKVSTKVSNAPFNVVEKMKKTNVNISMWDAIATIPIQRRLLQQELERIEPKDQPSNMESATRLVQPVGGEETSKKVIPPPFYVSLIIGGKLVHNCMLDSGASSSVMPRCVADALGMKYEPIVRDVLQLDGSTVKTIGILRNVEMALHACPGCTMIQDISTTEVKPDFSIYLSRDFIAQIGGFISVDWSYMSFETRYGANASIRAEPQSLHHTESYTPNFINMNCPILEMNEDDIVHEPSTSLAEIPDFFLDEWASAY